MPRTKRQLTRIDAWIPTELVNYFKARAILHGVPFAKEIEWALDGRMKAIVKQEKKSNQRLEKENKKTDGETSASTQSSAAQEHENDTTKVITNEELDALLQKLYEP